GLISHRILLPFPSFWEALLHRVVDLEFVDSQAPSPRRALSWSPPPFVYFPPKRAVGCHNLLMRRIACFLVRRESSCVVLENLLGYSQHRRQLRHEIGRRRVSAVVLDIVDVGDPDRDPIFFLDLRS